PTSSQGQGTIRNLLLGSNSWLWPGPSLRGLSVVVSGNAMIETGGGIMLDGQGYAGGAGTGAGRSLSSATVGSTGGGAGFGGYGGASAYGAPGGNYYGLLTSPSEVAGSGGGAGNGISTNNLGGSGGGAFELTVN